MEVYVLIEENVSDFETLTKNVEVFDNLEDANSRVLEIKTMVETIFDLTGWEIDDNTGDDEPLKSYETYESGRYAENHYSVTLWQREI